MKSVIDPGLPEFGFGRRILHATSGGHLRARSMALKPNATFEIGAAKIQIDLAVRKSRSRLGVSGSLGHVLQFLFSLTNAGHMPILDEIWRNHFEHPDLNRGIVIGSAIGVPGVVIFTYAHAFIESS